ncbi:YciI family protein [Massilia aerilata]|uniref:YciI family protein n=1 Tax=Massilia aerilata TaxID=453817 RepID=A0ABW0RUK5_9BURK
MQFMVMRRADEATEAGRLPAPAVFEDMGRYHEMLDEAGGVGLALGLRPSSRAVRLKLGPGGESLTDGPFAEAKELIAGFTVFEADSKEHALALLKQWPASDADATGEAVLELRETGCPGGCAQVPPAAAGEDARYLILLRSDEGTEADRIPPQAMLDALNAFNAEQAAQGRLLAGDGLKASSRGARVKLAGGQASVIDGPFAEAKELIAGFWMIRAASMADAVAWARTLPYPTGPHVEVEIREAMTMDDLQPAIDAAQRRLDASLRAEQLDAALRRVNVEA